MSKSTIHILVDRKNARLQYVASEFLERRLGFTVVLTTDEKSLDSNTIALNYSSKSMYTIPSIEPSKLLYEKRIQMQEIQLEPGDVPFLFPIKNHSLGFDPFAACFYLLSRYEEYLPRRNDEHDRFDENQHLLVVNGAHQLPLVENYADLFFTWLKGYYPDLERHNSTYAPLFTLDVDQLYSLKAKGLVGSGIGFLKDLLSFNALKRLKVITGRASDPNDIYDEVINLCKSQRVASMVFVQVGDGSKYDINNPPHLYTVRQRINEIGLQSDIGLHPSYYTSSSTDLFDVEVARLRNMTALPIQRSRQHYLRFKLPSTFRKLVEIDIKEDYSMGFQIVNGFRAGTCKPFYLYDLEREEILSIKMFPSAWMDLTAYRSGKSQQEVLIELTEIQRSVKEVGGMLITTWHPEVLRAKRNGYSTMQVFEHFIANVWS